MRVKIGDKIKFKNGKAIYEVVIINNDNIVYGRMCRNDFGKNPSCITLWRLNLDYCEPASSSTGKAVIL